MSAGEAESRHIDIWQLFKEAQQNILHLNEQCFDAIEELKKTKKGEANLLDKIVALESAKQTHFVKDSMVLSGVIGTRDAFQLRKIVMDKRIGMADVVTSVLQKTDSEVLANLQQLLEQSRSPYQP